MTRVVFAWELGAYLGHLERNLAVAQHLQQTGADVHFVVNNVQTKLLKPDVVVTDYAPSAILSAKIAGIRTLPLGPGFTIPPGRDPMTANREEQRHMTTELRAADQQLLPAINEAAKAFGPRDDAQYVGPVMAPGRFARVDGRHSASIGPSRTCSRRWSGWMPFSVQCAIPHTR